MIKTQPVEDYPDKYTITGFTVDVRSFKNDEDITKRHAQHEPLYLDEIMDN